jgi:epoxyqueuosine reductase QueG
LERDGDELRRTYNRLYVPKNDPRYLSRNALVALGNTGDTSDLDTLAPFLAADDDVVREHAEWAAAAIEERRD